jgi:hypothetical protein
MSDVTSHLPIAVRAYTPHLAGEAQRPRRGSAATPPGPQRIFVFDTESGMDHALSLTFGSSRVFTADRQRLDECLFQADALPAADRATLQRYAATHDEDVDPLHRKRLRVLSCRAWLKAVYWPTAVKHRALVVCFNSPFDHARVSSGWGAARVPPYAGGFSLQLFSYDRAAKPHVHPFRPRLAIKSLDSKRALMGFKRYRAPDAVDTIPEGAADRRPDPAYHFRGHFLDLRTLAFALTNQSHSLRSACKAFGVPPEETKGHATTFGQVTPEHIDYNRQDVRATAALYWKMQEEYARHPITLPITQAYSPASIGKAYLDAMGIRPVLERQPDFPKDVLGYFMAAYYGGRAEGRIRGVPVPVVYLDFLSMYPTVCSLMGIWRLLTCEHIEVQRDTATKEQVQALLDGVSLERCFDPQLWRQLVGLVQLIPDGDILPVRAHYAGESTWSIGVNPLTAREPQWFTLADVVASILLTGRVPRVHRAIRLVPHGVAATLRPVRLRGEIPVDPRTQDFFRVAIQERHRLEHRSDLTEQERTWLSAFLKVLANSAGYGIYGEMNPQELPKGERRRVEVSGNWEQAFSTDVHTPEEPGAYCFPPFAACISGAARLMLALLEGCVAEASGTYAMCDTDSLAVVASETGDLVPCPGGAARLPDGREAVRALSWAQVEAIRERFATLNPYDPNAVPGPVLKLEPENRDPNTGHQRQVWCYALSAKRYALFNLEAEGRPHLRKISEHGLGHLLNPTDPPDTEEYAEDDAEREAWMATLWEGIVTEALGQPCAWPAWLDRPALGRITASSPAMLRPFATWNAGKPYAQQVKPYNFLLTAYVMPFGHPTGVDPKRFHLVAPFETDPRKWAKLAWRNLYDASGTRYTIRTGASPYAVPGEVRVKTYRDVLDDYRRHPESKSLAPDGTPCTGLTVGLLRRRPVTALYLTHVGKESNQLEEVEAGLVHDPEEVYTEYQDPAHDPWATLAVPVLKQMPRPQLETATGLDRSTLTRLRNGSTQPRTMHRETLTHVAGIFARDQLAASGQAVPREDLAACASWLAWKDG